MPASTRALYEVADEYVTTLTRLWARIGPGASDARDQLNTMPEAVVWTEGEPFAVVLQESGPRVEITGGGNQGRYVLRVHGSHPVVRRGEAITRTGEYFRELYEEVL